MSELAAYFVRKSDVEVDLILYGITREIFYQVPHQITIHKPAFDFNNKQRLYYTLKTLIFLRKTIRKIAPDTILSFGEYWNNFLLLALTGFKYPVFVSDRSQPDKSLGKFHDLLRHWLYPRATGLILQTEKAKDIYVQKNRHKNITIIGNPIRQIMTKQIGPKREKIVLMVGRLIKSKHQDKLIEMFATTRLPGWRLMIVGYDHLKQNNLEQLKKLAAGLGIEEWVIFTGKVEDIEEVYLRSSIFAFTSSSEGFPNVIGEAMSAALPVIAFDCVAGPSEMITDGRDGFLLPLFDYEMFRLRLSQLMQDQTLRTSLGENARESVKRFSSEVICEKFYRFINQKPAIPDWAGLD